MDPSQERTPQLANKITESFGSECRIERDDLIAKLEVITSEGWQVLELAPSKEYLDRFKEPLAEVARILKGTDIRQESFEITPSNVKPNEKVLAELIDIAGEGHSLKSQSDRLAIWRDSSTLYHSTQLIDFLVLREVGWIAPLDLEWLRVDGAGNPQRDWGFDHGFSLTSDLRESVAYFSTGTSIIEDIYKALKEPLPDVFQPLLGIGILLSTTPSDLKDSFPHGKYFWRGTDRNEVACPMVPYFREDAGLQPVVLTRIKKVP